MFKAVIALGLVTSVTAKGGMDGVIQWLQEHGAEVLDTAEECLAMGDTIAKMQETCNEQENTAKNLAGLSVWGLVQGMEASTCPFAEHLANTSFARAAKEMAIAAVQESTHEQVDSFCGKAECKDLLHQFGSSYSRCYGHSACAALAHADFISYEDCKPIMTEFVEKSVTQQSKSVCSMERKHNFYCAEEQTALLLHEPVCYITLLGTAATEDECLAHADCVSVWSRAQKEYPLCSRWIASQAHSSIECSLEMVKTLFSKAKDPEVREQAKNMPTSMPLFLETCKGDTTINV
mmetsp:Transcript_3970/g.6695  ORF Transcript_3970/g.6695 Transcript_3970/m.6695 type:complete len:292 (-) Transcript_3970:119-994(-)